MSDKELLEFAAKAAGINGSYVENDDWYGTGIIYTDPDDCNQCWNPLTDDGDALRLAIYLGLVVDTYNLRAISGSRLNAGHNDWTYCDYDEEYDEDAATRRAIVRAAAEIGKAM